MTSRFDPTPRTRPRVSAGWRVFLAIPAFGLMAAAAHADAAPRVVRYEAFGAIGDGVADDLPAIRKAHAHANEHDLPVRSDPEATYHLGRQALTATIQTNTDWGTSKFIIDDSQGADDFAAPIFEVTSRLDPIPLEIERLTRGQTRLDVRPSVDCLVAVENKNRRIFIRRGGNRNQGTVQQEVFILRRDGSIDGGIDWDYDSVTRVVAQPIDPQPLVVRGGHFTHIANRDESTRYWGRNIVIRRSNTEIDAITHRATGEGDVGSPYRGFLHPNRAANVTLRNCVIDGRKTYHKIGNAGSRVPMGSYGYNARSIVNFRMIGCRMDDIHDRGRWGVIGTNFMKNILIEDCELSRMDVHQGVSGNFIVRRTTLGHAGLNAIGRGRLLIEDATLHGRHLVNFRSDYGSTWDGVVLIRDSRWIPPARNATMFGMRNDGMHDFGYSCTMPRAIRIEGLFVDDSGHGEKHRGITFFQDPLGKPRADRPFPYRLTERLEVAGLETASGLPPRVCANPEIVDAVTVATKSAGSSAGRKGGD